MAANNTSNVRFAPNGRLLVRKYDDRKKVLRAGNDILDPGKPLPQEGENAWHEMGWVTADGVELTPSIKTSEVEAWQSATPIIYSVESAALQVKATLMEVNPTVTQTYFGTDWVEIDGLEGVYGLDIKSNPDLSEIVMAIEWEDGKDRNRLIIPHAIVSDRDSIKLTRKDNQEFGLTIDALDEDGELAKLVTTKNMSGSGGGKPEPKPGKLPAQPKIKADFSVGKK
ncbi:hypothetical protein ACFY1P_08160 [Streptomyces sp. NPDC001407]|uniref:phage tail tube protein n=1 Tax=Streptomyces sp. NPDC001407 TaxID=3364573 RepID=UPI00367579DC